MKREPSVDRTTLAHLLGITESFIDSATARGAPGGRGEYQVGAFLAWLLMESGVGNAKAA